MGGIAEGNCDLESVRAGSPVLLGPPDSWGLVEPGTSHYVTNPVMWRQEANHHSGKLLSQH